MILRGNWLVVHVEGDSERKVNTKYVAVAHVERGEHKPRTEVE